MFSKSCIYAIKIMIYFALQKPALEESEVTYIGVSQVKDAIGSPQPFTAKILQQLSKAGMLESLRGPNGGFCLPKDKKVSLEEIVRVIDGNQLLDGCVLGFKECSEHRPCPAHFKFKSVRDYLKGALASTDVEEMKQIIEVSKGYIKY